MDSRHLVHLPNGSSAVRAVLFDAVRTLIYPVPAVPCVYRAAGIRHGIQLELDEVKQRFRAACDLHFVEGRTDECAERRRWQSVVAAVFRTEGERAEALFRELWGHFADSRHWAVYPDVEPVCSALRQRGLQLGVASNFDGRLIGICRNLPQLADLYPVFCSSQVGHAKPHSGFFRAVGDRLGLDAHQLLLVGDDPERDYAGALRAGWHALHLARDGRGGQGSLRGLEQVLEWFSAQ